MPIPPDTPLLVLSPHLDDAVFSASALLERDQVEVWTVFAGAPDPSVCTDWDRRCGYSSGAELIRDRRDEDALAMHGLTFEHLDCLERAYTTPERRKADMQMLATRITAWLEGHPGASIAVPVGAGVRLPPAWHTKLRRRWRQQDVPLSPDDDLGSTRPPIAAGSVARSPLRRLAQRVLHAAYLRRRRRFQRRGMLANEDHLELRDLVASHFDAWRVPLLAYEDMPYAWSQPGDDAAHEVAAFMGVAPTPLTLAPDRDTKFARISRYATQLAVMDPILHRLERHDTIPYPERYWRFDPRCDRERS